MNNYIIQFTTLKRYCKHIYDRPAAPGVKFRYGCNHKVLKRKKKIEMPKELIAHYRCTETNCPILKRLGVEGSY